MLRPLPFCVFLTPHQKGNMSDTASTAHPPEDPPPLELVFPWWKLHISFLVYFPLWAGVKEAHSQA